MNTREVYVITGGNRGLGFAMTKILSNDSNNIVIATSRNPDKSQELLTLAAKCPNVHIVKLDVQSKESAFSAAEEVKKITGGVVDILIANSGIADAFYTVLETPSEIYENHWKTNFLGVIHTYQAFYSLMKDSLVKKIILISSAMGSIGAYSPGSISGYGSTKAALNYLARTLAFELKNEGFTVVSIRPGFVLSDMGIYGLETMRKKLKNADVVNNIATLTPEASAQSILKLVDNISIDDSDSFLSYDGSKVTW